MSISIQREQELDDMAFSIFATIYPHEAYAEWPERFLAYAEAKTGRSREVILKVLKETEGP